MGIPRPSSKPDHFDPSHLRPIASLNRRRFLVAAPGDEQILGKSAHEVLSALAFAESLATVPELALPLDVHPGERFRRLQNYLAEDHSLGNVARALVERYGQRLGYFFMSLNRANTLAADMDAWESAYLAHWEDKVRTIVLGGGLVTGKLGKIVAHAAQDVLARAGSPVEVVVAPHAYLLPLIGIARTIPRTVQGTAVVADFGHTSAKSAIAYFDDKGALARLHPDLLCDIAMLTAGDKTAELAEMMKQIIVARIQEARQQGIVVSRIVCSLAAYLDERQQPMKIDRGAYTRLHTIAQPLEVSEWLAREINAWIRLEGGTEVTVSFLRDTEAAASAYAGVRPARTVAVVMLGTAMGVGFVPD